MAVMSLGRGRKAFLSSRNSIYKGKEVRKSMSPSFREGKYKLQRVEPLSQSLLLPQVLPQCLAWGRRAVSVCVE